MQTKIHFNAMKQKGIMALKTELNNVIFQIQRTPTGKTLLLYEQEQTSEDVIIIFMLI